MNLKNKSTTFIVTVCMLVLVSGCPILEALAFPDRPVILSVSTGDYNDKISVSWSAPTLENDTSKFVHHSVVSWSLDGITFTDSSALNGTSYDIIGIQPGKLYVIKVTAYFYSTVTDTPVGSSESSEKTGFAMNASLLAYYSTPKVLAVGGTTEYWYETMLQKGFIYYWASVPSGSTIAVYPKGTIDPGAETWSASVGIPGNASWTCNSTGNQYRFYVKITTPNSANYNLSYWFGVN